MKKIFWVIIFVLLIVANIYLYKLNIERKANLEKNESYYSLNQSERNVVLNNLESNYIWGFAGLVVIIILAVLFFLIKKQT
ncbi:MAG: hypothetical protein NTW17_01980 [Candidatus Pacearchaeota archaeon]|nr:hypothetical protein [Candidatus Pacearchaeota archaeon]